MSNVLYRTEANRLRYVFTAEYTVGVVRAARLTRVAAFTEPRDRGPSDAPVVLARGGLPPLEQYRSLLSGGSVSE